MTAETRLTPQFKSTRFFRTTVDRCVVIFPAKRKFKIKKFKFDFGMLFSA